MSDFNPDEYLKEKSAPDDFNPDEYLAKATPASKVDTAVMQGLQGATAGFLDEASGAGEAIGRALGIEGLGGSFSDVGFAKGGPTLDKDILKEAYRRARDRKRGILKKQEADNPATAGVAKFAGMVASPLSKATKGLSLARAGGVIGGVNALGESTAEDLPGMAKDTAIGYGTGAILGKGIEKASPYISAGTEKLGKGARNLAERFAGRALGAERGTIKSLGADKVQAAGAHALDEGILSPLANTDDLIARNEAAKKAGGKLMDKAYTAIDDAGASTFNPLKVASEVDDQIGGFYRSPINRGEANQLENTLESILMRGEGNIPIKEAQVLKQELGKVANWKNNLNITEKEKMAREAYGIVSRNIDDAVKSGSDLINQAGLGDILNKGKAIFGNASTAEKLLQNKLAREQGNKLIGLTDWGVLGAGGGLAVPTGGASVPVAMGMTAAKKGLEKYGAQNTALALNKVSKMLMKTPRFAEMARNNPKAFNALAASIAKRAGGGVMKAAGNEPMSDEESKAAFVEGN